MATPIASSAAQTITNIVFGIVATCTGIAAIWQARRVWINHRRHAGDADAGFNRQSRDIELGLLHSSPTGLFELPASPVTVPSVVSLASEVTPQTAGNAIMPAPSFNLAVGSNVDGTVVESNNWLPPSLASRPVDR